MQQFLKKVRLTVSGLVINPGGMNVHELKIGFSVSKTISSTANTAEIEIWNLNEGHRNALGKELDEVTLEAGYMPPLGGDNVGVIFKGQMRDVEHRRDGPDIISKISCGDGDKAFRKATTSKSFPAGTPVKDVMEEIYSQLAKEGVSKGEWKFPDDMKDFKRPYALCGACTREADRIGRGKGFYWSVQNGVMEIVPGDDSLSGTVFLSSKTGLVETPTITDNGVKFQALLNPEVRPGRRVQIESETLEMNGEGGLYRVSQVTYEGDNRQGKFRVSGHGEAIQGGKVDEGKKP